MATITVRRLDASYDPVHGQGQNDFISDRAAVAQIIGTRIRLLMAEWWENTADGTPLFQKMLGVAGAGRNQSAINQILQTRIYGAPYVTGISDVASSYNPITRAYKFACIAQTAFGEIPVSSDPQPANQAYPGVYGIMGSH